MRVAAPWAIADWPSTPRVASRNRTVPVVVMGKMVAESVMGLLASITVGSAASVMVAGIAAMVVVTAALVDGVRRVSPEYVAVMECGPGLSDAVEKLALPFARRIWARIGLPSRNVMVPVAALGLTLAAKVTGVPKVLIEGIAARVTVLGARLICVVIEVKDARSLVSPL